MSCSLRFTQPFEVLSDHRTNYTKEGFVRSEESTRPVKTYPSQAFLLLGALDNWESMTRPAGLKAHRSLVSYVLTIDGLYEWRLEDGLIWFRLRTEDVGSYLPASTKFADTYQIRSSWAMISPGCVELKGHVSSNQLCLIGLITPAFVIGSIAMRRSPLVQFPQFPELVYQFSSNKFSWTVRFQPWKKSIDMLHGEHLLGLNLVRTESTFDCVPSMLFDQSNL